jgi:hypothetical protein
MVIELILVIVALVCFALAAIGVSSRINLVAAGLFCWLLAVGLLPHLHIS